MARPAGIPPGSMVDQLKRQRALGRYATHVEVREDPDSAGWLLRAGPRTVSVGQARSPEVRAWQLAPVAELDGVLRSLHALILEEAHALPELLAGLASTPEADAPRAVRGRLQRMLALRSVLELAAAWEDAPRAGDPTPGWTSGPSRTICVLPWHAGPVEVSEGWHLHQLRRWHQPHPENGNWAAATVGWITRAALLQDVGPGSSLAGPLSAGSAERRRQREAGATALDRPLARPGSIGIDLDPSAFVRRVRLALSALLDPALCSFGVDEVLQAVQGARSGVAALSRLLPGVASGPVQALGERLRAERLYGGRPWGNEAEIGKGSLTTAAAGPSAVRRSAWTAALADSVFPHACLATEAAAGPLHLLMPGLQHSGPGGRENWISMLMEEVRDLFAAVAALPAEQDMPLPDMSELLTGRGFLRLGAHAPAMALERSDPEDPELGGLVPGRDGSQEGAHVPGLGIVVLALQMINAHREQQRALVRSEVSLATGLSEDELAEATGGERAFDRSLGDLALERVLHWSGGVWSLQLARHPQDLVSDGRALSHCVGWGGYAQSMRAGHARIVRVLSRGPEDEHARPLLTLELGRCGTANGEASPSWRVVQARGARNRAPTGDEATLLALWARQVGVDPGTGTGIAALTASAARAERARLEAEWETGSVQKNQPAPPTSEAVRRAVQLSADLTAACWTPATTRTHQEALRRIAGLVERARTHLTAELRRLHDTGDALLVGPIDGDDLLSGTGELILTPDARPLLHALKPDEPGSPRVVGLRAERRTYLGVSPLLQAHEQRQTLDLRPGKRSGEIALHFSATGRTPVISHFGPASLTNTGLLDPLHLDDGQNAWTGVARKRVAGLTLLRSLLDEPLGELEEVASAVTRQPGRTLRDQLGSWSKTATGRRTTVRGR